MQDWYVHTDNITQLQMETLSDFLTNYNLGLPQVSPEHQYMLGEEITEAEVQEDIGEAHEISAPGSSGQTITLCKLIFQSLRGIVMGNHSTSF